MNTQQPPLGVGIVGCGNVLGAYLALLEKLHFHRLAELKVLCGRERQREAALAAWPGAVFITDYQELLTRPDVEVVVVLAPMREHAWMARRALESGKHVVLEKPLATSLEEAAEVLKVAEHSKRHLVCAPFTLLSPTFQTIATRVRGGDIGRVVSARARYGWAGPDWAEWFYRAGGGALFDLGVYSVTTLTGLLGPVRRVAAMTGVALPRRVINGQEVGVEAEDNAQVLLDFGDNCFAVVTSGFTLQQYRGPGVELFGTEGTLYLLGDDWDPNGYELWQNSAGCWQTYPETHPDWPWTDGLRHLVECLHRGTIPMQTGAHALHVLEVMLKAQQAAREKRTLEILSSFEALPLLDHGEGAPAAHRVHDRTRAEGA
jgi:predicted dehydrogenase